MNVDVDEAGDDVMTVKVVGARLRAGADVGDAIAVDDERAWRQRAIGEEKIGAREDDHFAAAAPRRAAPIAAASAPRAAGAMASACIIAGGSRRPISTRTGSRNRSAADAM